jgi:hypothetical protein
MIMKLFSVNEKRLLFMKNKITMLLLTIFTVFTLTACEMPSQSVNLGQTNED